MKLNTTELMLNFSPERIVPPFAWVGHIPFLAQLLSTVEPKIFVELGTHTGNSYLAACQAIDSFTLSTQSYAIDTWEGDPQAGFYDNLVYETLSNYHNPKYGHFSRLLRMTFDKALIQFADASIDLLHIDGLHTYEAVKYDFETWLPKMSSNGIILFHDIAVKENDFGVWQLWDEICTTYPLHFSFSHSNGLGVLFINKPDSSLLQAMIDEKSTNDIVQLLEHTGNKLLRIYENELKFNTTTQALENKQQELNALFQEFKLLQNLHETCEKESQKKEIAINNLLTTLTASQPQLAKLEQWSPHIKLLRWIKHNLLNK